MPAHRLAPQGEAFHVRKSDLRETRWAETVQPGPDTLRPGQLVAEVTNSPFTANNITYACTGEQLGYWRFFAAPDGWGVIPVWGFAEVLHSQASGIAPGERIYGYMPMASHVLLEAGATRGVRFNDISAERASLPATYNEYVLIDRDPAQGGGGASVSGGADRGAPSGRGRYSDDLGTIGRLLRQACLPVGSSLRR